MSAVLTDSPPIARALLPMESVVFTVPGQPVAKGRPRIGKVGAFSRLYTPPKTVSYEGLVAVVAQAAMNGRAMFDEPLCCDVQIDCQVPAIWSIRKTSDAYIGKVMPSGRPDLDNVVKAVFDGLNGVLWRDDSLVCTLFATKRYAATPGVRVRVWPALQNFTG